MLWEALKLQYASARPRSKQRLRKEVRGYPRIIWTVPQDSHYWALLRILELCAREPIRSGVMGREEFLEQLRLLRRDIPGPGLGCKTRHLQFAPECTPQALNLHLWPLLNSNFWPSETMTEDDMQGILVRPPTLARDA